MPQTSSSENLNQKIHLGLKKIFSKSPAAVCLRSECVCPEISSSITISKDPGRVPWVVFTRQDNNQNNNNIIHIYYTYSYTISQGRIKIHSIMFSVYIMFSVCTLCTLTLLQQTGSLGWGGEVCTFEIIIYRKGNKVHFNLLAIVIFQYVSSDQKLTKCKIRWACLNL